MTTPPIRQFLNASGTSTGLPTPSVTTGAGTLSTDLLVLVHYDDYGRLADMGTPSSGSWTLLASDQSAPNGAIKAWSKPAVGGAETVSVTQAGNGRAIAVWVIQNATPDGAAASGATYTQTQTASSVTTTDAAGLLIRVFGTITFNGNSGLSYTLPSGLTQDLNTNFDSSSGFILAAHKSLTASGATGTQSATGPTTAGVGYNTVTLAFKSSSSFSGTSSATVALASADTGTSARSGSRSASEAIASHASGISARTGSRSAATAIASHAAGVSARSGSRSAATAIASHASGAKHASGTSGAIIALTSARTGASTRAASSSAALAEASGRSGSSGRLGASTAHLGLVAGSSATSTRNGTSTSHVTLASTTAAGLAGTSTAAVSLVATASGIKHAAGTSAAVVGLTSHATSIPRVVNLGVSIGPTRSDSSVTATSLTTTGMQVTAGTTTPPLAASGWQQAVAVGGVTENTQLVYSAGSFAPMSAVGGLESGVAAASIQQGLAAGSLND